ncbi:MAG: amidohydrolase [Spartobacteria bacterium]
MKFLLLCLFLAVAAEHSVAQTDQGAKVDGLKNQVIGDLQSGYDKYKKIALDIWDYSEVGFKETRSSLLLQNALKENGFTMEPGVAGMPTAFVATYGSGQPIIGILAEFDALPGLSQESKPIKSPAMNRKSGHGCGHNLFGTGSVAAGIAIKNLIEKGTLKGTIKIYGTPAEEGGDGKVYMVREGLFRDVDVALHWHPDEHNTVTYTSSLAIKTAKFRFHGISAHAAAAPDKGRSALDAVEAMDYMVNMMREHIPQESRIHYVISDGGQAPNVVPDFSEVFYYVRHPEKVMVNSLFERVVNAANGAALGTGTKMDYEVISGSHDLLINKTLAEVMMANLKMVGGVSYTETETQFAKELQSTFLGTVPSIDSAGKITPLHLEKNQGSTDVGDVSYVVPTVGLETATWVPGTPAHSWQAVACSGNEIGIKGMMVAAKTMALTAIDLLTDPSLITQAKEEFRRERGTYQYKALLGDRKPALNYRD